jgi:hypothetical protein
LIGSHRGTGAIGVAVGVLTELRIPCPVPLVLNAPALPDQLQQCVWGGAQAGDEPVAGHRSLSLPRSGGGGEFRNPGAAGPIRFDVLGCFLCPELPAGVTPVPFLEIRCGERDLALALELAADLAVEGLLVRFDGQQDDGPLLQTPEKNACVVWRASAWTTSPAASLATAVDAITVTSKLSAPALHRGEPHAMQQGRFMSPSTIGHAFVEDLQGLPAIVRRGQSSPSSPQKA